MAKRSYNKVLFGCIFFSLSVHVLALFSLNKHLLWLYSPYMNLLGARHHLGESIALEQIEKKAKQDIVDIIFSIKEKTIFKTKAFGYHPEEQQISEKTVQLKLNTKKFSRKACNEYSLKIKDPLIKKIFTQMPIADKKQFKKKNNEEKFLENLKYVSLQMKKTWKDNPFLEKIYPVKKEQLIHHLPIHAKIQQEKRSSHPVITFSTEKQNKLLLQELKRQQQQPYEPEEQLLANSWLTPSILPTLKDLKTVSYNNEIDLSVSYCPLHNEEGYIFAITLIPHIGTKLRKIHHNYYYFIDCSNSIQRNRLTKTRHALASSLAFLKKNDHFNIISFDHQFSRLFNTSHRLTQSSYKQARQFLLHLSLGSFFISTDFSHPLFSLFSVPVNEKEMHSVILLTNGEEIHKAKNMRILEKWSRINNGAFSLYIVTLDSDKNSSILELFAKKNKGKLVSASSIFNIKRQLQKLMKSINYPIAKNLVSTIYGKEASAHVELFPSFHQLPHFYANQPFVILGKTKKLDDFILFLQGKNQRGWFHLKKNISFKEATQAGKALEEQWALIQSYQCYNDFLLDNNPKHLQEAKHILQPYGIKSLFE